LSTEDNKKEPNKKKVSSSDEFPIQEYKLVPVDHMEYSNNEDEIDLIELAKTIWDNRKTIYKFVGVGFLLGILFALLSTKEYVSSATLMPEYAKEGNLGGASSLIQQFGGAFGISGGSYSSNSNAIRVDLYPRIVSSLTFQDKLAREEFYFAKYDTTTSIYDYYLELEGVGVLSFIFDQEISRTEGYINSGIIRLSKSEMAVIEELRSRVSANLDDESGIVSVSAKMEDPELAANITKYAIEELTEYLTNYRIEKVLNDLEFVQEQLEGAKRRFEEAQLILADFDDGNQGNLTARAQTERQRLRSEYDIAVNVYNSLTQQFEEAKLKVQEETPVFKVLQPVQVPVEPTGPGKLIYIFAFILLSLFGSMTLVIIEYLFLKK
jgi:uncharacterized protein involved in exopolysaccharide biosynthesis